MLDDPSPLVCIVGPTASGKSAIGLAVAERLGGEVINADSRQVYRELDIGTAKPSTRDRHRVPHHLFDVAAVDGSYSLAQFLQGARAAVADVQARHRLPLLVGGTGQYVWALVEGWRVPAVPPSADIRGALATEAAAHGAEVLFRRLQRVDPDAAQVIDPRNLRRVIRALEVWTVTGMPFSAQRQRRRPAFPSRLFGLWLDRAELYRRADRRVEAMVDAGWPSEVRRLLDAGHGEHLPSFRSVGYRELAAAARGQSSLEEAVQRTKWATHRLIRRQLAWFRRSDGRIAWYQEPGELLVAVGRALASEGEIRSLRRAPTEAWIPATRGGTMSTTIGRRHYAFTYGGDDGNRLVSGRGSMPHTPPIELRVPGVPRWLLGASLGDGSFWVVLLDSGGCV